MQISELAKQYVSTTSSSEAMKGTRGVEKLVSSIRDLTAGNIFEGTVNSVQDGKVVLGLSNGSLINARLDAGMQLSQGQSMFFQVKSNNGETIAIRPYTVGGNGVNLTLLNALNAAGLPVTDKYLNLANNMMQEQMPIDKNTMNQMARILMANPDMSVNTLVQMKKLNLPITNEMVAQFENYVDDSSAVHKALDSFITELPTTMAGKDMPLEQLKAFDSQLLMIIADGMEGSLAEVGVAQATAQNMILTEGLVQGITQGDSQQGILPEGSAQQVVAPEGSVQEVVSQENNAQQTMAQSAATQEGGNQQVVVQEWIPGQMTSETSGSQVETSQVANTQQVATQENPAQETIATQEAGNLPETSAKQTTESAAKENVLRLLNGLFGETNITAEDSPAVMLNKLSHFIMTGENVSKETLSQLFSSKDMQQFLRDALEGQNWISDSAIPW